MKLWLKISLIAVSLMAVAMIICSAILVISNREREMGRATESALDEHALFCTYFQQGVYDNITPGSSMTAQKSIVKYVFSNYTVKYESGSEFAITLGNEPIYNKVKFDPASVAGLPESPITQHIIRNVDGGNILFVARSFEIADGTYTIYLAHDITDVFEDIEVFTRQTVFINASVIILAAVTMLLLVRFAMRPLKALESGSKLIAEGVYDKRIDIHTNDEIGKVALSFNTMASAIEMRIAELSAALAQIERTAQQRKMFIANLTHELKTPMTSIIGYSEALLSFNMNEEQRERALQFLNRECKRLESLSGKLMQILVAENKEIALEQVSICKLFENVSLATHKPLENKHLRLESRTEIDTLEADGDLLTSAIANLVDNAIKASAPGAVIELLAYEQNGRKIIEVKDYGKGIPKDRIDIVSVPFYQVAGEKKKDSVGLGLSFVKTVADLHHAEIKIESKMGKGTSIQVVF